VSSKRMVLVFSQPLLALVFSRRSVLESSQLWLVLASFPLYAKSALESSPSSMQMALVSYQISKLSVLVFRAADILDHVASSVDICRAEMDNIHRLNKFSRMDQNCTFARIQVAARMSNFARRFAHSQVEYLSTFSHTDHVHKSSGTDHAHMFAHNLLANLSMTIGRPIHYHFDHRQKPLIMNLRQSIKSTT